MYVIKTFPRHPYDNFATKTRRYLSFFKKNQKVKHNKEKLNGKSVKAIASYWGEWKEENDILLN